MMLVLFFYLTFSILVYSTELPNHSIDELHQHFSVDKQSIQNVGHILDRMKRISYGQQLAKQGFHDVDNTKMLDLSTKQKNSVSLYLFEGDIFLSEQQATNILTYLENSRATRSLSNEKDALWAEFPIKYKFHESIDSFTIRLIVEAIEYWQSNTCIDFLQTDEPEGDYIEFFKGQGCFSMIGHFGGRQSISIGSGCERIGIIEHEIGHALGLWHQQSRPDANKFIEVEKDFILPTYISDFQLRGTDEITTLGIPYDFGSDLHYGPTAFSVDGKSFTLVTKDARYQRTIGQREKLSFLDIEIINKAYCKDACVESDDVVSCSNGGVPHPRNCKTCICPDGYAGNQCKQNEEAKNAECGGILKANKNWTYIESPGYEDGGYSEDQKCSWLVQAQKGMRIEIKFVDFGFLCTTSCVDYVELKLAKNQRLTGPRFCCHKKPDKSLISDSSSMAIIFRSQYSEELGFKLKFRETTQLPETSIITSTTPAPKIPKKGLNVWSEWASWTKCTKDCGACGIQSRVRECLSKSCTGRNQEFATCNQQPCVPNKSCEKARFLNRLCKTGKVCTELAEKLADCDQPSCCPPFYLSDNRCSNDDQKISFGK